jgi:hypothetical protein
MGYGAQWAAEPPLMDAPAAQARGHTPLRVLRERLEGLTYAGEKPLKLAFMCLVADHSSPRMKRHFDAETKYLGLGSHFETTAVPWGLNPYAPPPVEEHVEQLSRRLAEFDVVLPITPKEGRREMPLNPWLAQALEALPPEGRPLVLPFVVEARKRELFTDRIDGKDYRKVVEDVVDSVLRRRA